MFIPIMIITTYSCMEKNWNFKRKPNIREDILGLIISCFILYNESLWQKYLDEQRLVKCSCGNFIVKRLFTNEKTKTKFWNKQIYKIKAVEANTFAKKREMKFINKPFVDTHINKT